MNDKQIFIDFKSNYYNLILETKDISKVGLITPVEANLAANLVVEKEKILLNVEDKIMDCYSIDKQVACHFYSANLFSKNIRILIPEDLIVNLNVNLKNNSIFLKDLIFDKFNLSSLRGNITIKNCNGGITSINGYTSNILLHNLSGKKCIVSTKTGKIVAKNNLPYNTELKTDIGNIYLQVPDYFLKNTKITLEYENAKKLTLLTEQNYKKKLVLSAPNGRIITDIYKI